MPSSVKDRPTSAHEHVFMFAKSRRYFYDADAVRQPSRHDGHSNGVGFGHGYDQKPRYRKREDLEGAHGRQGHDGNGMRMNQKWNNPKGRNLRTVLSLPTHPTPFAHFATFPEDLVRPWILAGSRPGDTVLDCFCGSGTTLKVAMELGRKAIGIDLNPSYMELIRQRTDVTPGLPGFTAGA
jgi:hypothetical protein